MSGAAPVVHAEGICFVGVCPSKRCDHQAAREEEIEICRKWIRENAHHTKTVRKRYSSYAWKHRVEESTIAPGVVHAQVDHLGREWVGHYLYVSNGSFIHAALREGYRIEPCGGLSPNVFLNLALRRVPLGRRTIGAPISQDEAARLFKSPSVVALFGAKS